MLKIDANILKYNHGEKFMKALCFIYAEMEPLLEKIDTCHNNHWQLKKINILLQVIRCLLIVHLMSQKTSMINIEVIV